VTKQALSPTRLSVDIALPKESTKINLTYRAHMTRRAITSAREHIFGRKGNDDKKGLVDNSLSC
jgi:hypothetical protein